MTVEEALARLDEHEKSCGHRQHDSKCPHYGIAKALAAEVRRLRDSIPC